MPFVETLESRTLLSATPDIYEQYLLALVNRARQDPAAEAARYGIDLNEGVDPSQFISTAAKQPLAFNAMLNQSAQDHSQWMLDNDIFAHDETDGSTPRTRDEAAGYVFTPPTASGENLAYTGQEFSYPEILATIDRLHRNLFVDDNIAGRGHRTTMLADFWTESGVGIVGGIFTTEGKDFFSWMLSNEFATTAGDHFLTGTVFVDTMRQDGFYTPYEGLGQVTIEARQINGSGIYTTQTWDAGGYSLQLPAGQYQVSAYGGELSQLFGFGNVTIGEENVLGDMDVSGYADMPQLAGDGVLLIAGSAIADVIHLTDQGDRLRVERNGATMDFARNLVKSIEIHGGDGNDYIEVDATLDLVTGISGDRGNDTILGGAGTDYISGDDGNDVINGRFGPDSIHGGAGNDYIEGRGGNDTIYGGKGRDTLLGGNQNDVLFGGKAADSLVGGDGDDTLTGGANHDTLLGENGNDWLYGENNAIDYMDGGAGFNRATVDPLLDVYVNVVLT